MLPVLSGDDPRRIKDTLEGNYELRVVKAVDISKPTAKPVDEIDEPENEDQARENWMNQSNARMLQLTVRDENNTEIFALETERIPELDDVKPNWNILIDGPVEVRCGNIMLEKRHIVGKQQLSESQVPAATVIALEVTDSNSECPISFGVQPNNVALEESMPVVLQAHNATANKSSEPPVDNQMPEDWDDLDEDDDDCIILD